MKKVKNEFYYNLCEKYLNIKLYILRTKIRKIENKKTKLEQKLDKFETKKLGSYLYFIRLKLNCYYLEEKYLLLFFNDIKRFI